MTYVTPATTPPPPPPPPQPFPAVTLSHAAIRWGVGGELGRHVYLSSAVLGGAASREAAAVHPVLNGQQRLQRLIDTNGRRGFAVSDGCSAADTAEDWTQIMSRVQEGGGSRGLCSSSSSRGSSLRLFLYLKFSLEEENRVICGRERVCVCLCHRDSSAPTRHWPESLFRGRSCSQRKVVQYIFSIKQAAEHWHSAEIEQQFWREMWVKFK